MITSLTIKNYALIEQVYINLEKGFTVITGETGAGKSILIDAFNLVLGERTTPDVVRRGSEKAYVEATIDISKLKLKEFFNQHEIEFTNELILRREISSKGQSRSFINDSPVSLSVLKEIGDLLVDLHGQHDHQILLNAGSHLSFLDSFSGTEDVLQKYLESYRELSKLNSEKKELQLKQFELTEKKNLYEFQLKEISTVNPILNEEDELNGELNIYSNAEKLHDITEKINALLYSNEESASVLIHKALKQIENLSQIDLKVAEEFKELENVYAIVNELAAIAKKYQDKLNYSPSRLEEIRERLGALSLLRKKYMKSTPELIEYSDKIKKELNLLENFEEELNVISEKIESARSKVKINAEKLSGERITASKKIEKLVCSLVGDLGIMNCKFLVKNIFQEFETPPENGMYIINNKKIINIKPTGIDNVEFYISTNLGEEPKALNKVASGGEISRIMLALKSVLAKGDNVPILIFDEIDVGVSGRIAEAVGKKLKELSKSHQIIAITHLPQIASLANNHFVVEKASDKFSTTSNIKKINNEERIVEIAKLMSGEKISQSSLDIAKTLLQSK